MTPDRSPDLVRSEPVADEIDRCNVIRFECHRHHWTARLGPRDGGLEAAGNTIEDAVSALLGRARSLGWTFDETWREPPSRPREG